MQVNGGAAFTNNRNVTLNVAATDPLIDNLPNTSSGVTQAAVDVDGNGTHPLRHHLRPEPRHERLRRRTSPRR